MRTGSRLCTGVCVVVAVLAAAPAGAQAPVVTLRGQIVAADNGAALPRAQVRLDATQPGDPVFTDEQGRFALAVAAAAAPTSTAALPIVVSKAGFATTTVAASRSGTTDVALARSGAISGRIVDQYGQPQPGLRAAARRVDRPPATPSVAVETDDLGEFRIGALYAGRYVVSFATETESLLQRPDEVTVEVRVVGR